MNLQSEKESIEQSYKEQLESAERLFKIRQHLVETQQDSLTLRERKRKRSVDDEVIAWESPKCSNAPRASLLRSTSRSTVLESEHPLKHTISKPAQQGGASSDQSTRLQNPHHQFGSEQKSRRASEVVRSRARHQQCATLQNTTSDPMIYPGLYAPSGFDMLSILLRVVKRPKPIFNIGHVDSSCALVLCSLSANGDESDTPIVYCSDAFSHLTHYRLPEIVGRNCRFLQSPDGLVARGSARKHVDGKQIYDLKQRLRRGEETQTCLINYKKGGEKFINLLTTVEIEWGGDKGRYIVGFQAQGPAHMAATIAKEKSR